MLEAKKILEDITGEEITTFRAPSLRTNRYTARALIETGHKIDSSVASQRFDLFLSFGSMRKINWMFAPRLPYHVDPSSLFKKGNSALIEIPLSATLMPYVGTTMRVFPNLSKMQHSILHFENKRNGKPIVFHCGSGLRSTTTLSVRSSTRIPRFIFSFTSYSPSFKYTCSITRETDVCPSPKSHS